MKNVLLAAVLTLAMSAGAAAQTLPTVKVATTPIDVSAINEAGAWANKNQAASAKTLEKYTKIESKPDIKRVTFPEKSDLTLMQPAIDATAKYKVIKATFPAADLAAPK